MLGISPLGFLLINIATLIRHLAIFSYESLFITDLEIECSISRCTVYHANKTIIKQLFEQYRLEPPLELYRHSYCVGAVFMLSSILALFILIRKICYTKPRRPRFFSLKNQKRLIKLKSAAVA